MKAHLITRKGWEALDKELKYLWKEYRPEITLKVQEAAAQGDRSENADYTYNKRLLRQIDRRIRYLVKRLEELKIVDYSPQQEGKVFFGAWVELENDQGTVVRYRIVGKDEIDTKKGYITIDSPMARALIGKQVDDEVQV
ncbi:MAG: transcription elongation factor GreB, partial [Shewanella algae]